MTSLTGAVAVVTGASRGIGLAVAESLATAGWTVIRLARSLTDGRHGAFHDLRCDLAEPAEVAEVTSRMLGEWGAPRLVVQSAGAFLLAPVAATTADDFDRLLTINLRAPFALAHGLLPAMRAAGRGIHVTIGSISDHRAFPENAAYTASKFGVRGLHEALAEEYRGSGLRFTLVSPGPTDTPIWDPVDPDTRPGFLPRARMLRPADVAEAVLFVATRPRHAVVELLRLMPSSVPDEE